VSCEERADRAESIGRRFDVGVGHRHRHGGMPNDLFTRADSPAVAYAFLSLFLSFRVRESADPWDAVTVLVQTVTPWQSCRSV
jgi:hypothetical protein